MCAQTSMCVCVYVSYELKVYVCVMEKDLIFLFVVFELLYACFVYIEI